MEFRDLKKQYAYIKEEIDQNIQKVLEATDFIQGSMVAELEETLANYTGMKHCIACANGTDALQLALMVWDIGPGDAVFVPDFTFFASGEVVSMLGATPVFVDVDEDTFNMDAESLEKMINRVLEEGKLRPGVIVTVDLFGLPADYQKIREVAGKYRLLILEDGAQGFGGAMGGRAACSFGDISTTSFFPAKPLGCYGDGGAVFTDNDEWAELLRSYRVHGKGQSKYDNIRIGMNSRLDTIQAAVLLAKFPVFKAEELQRVEETAKRYTAGLTGLVKTPAVGENYGSSWAQYTIRLASGREREQLQEYLKEKMIPSAVYYQKPMHRMKAFEGNLYQDSDYPVTNRLSEVVLSLPFHPYMSEEEVQMVVAEVSGFLRGCR